MNKVTKYTDLLYTIAQKQVLHCITMTANIIAVPFVAVWQSICQ